MDVSLLGEINRVCNDFALALQHWEIQIYSILTIVLLIGATIFPTPDSE